MHNCPTCNRRISDQNKFCDRNCVREGYRLGIIINSGNFKKGSVSLNKGHTLESWVGEEKAKEIKARMSLHSRGKAAQLRRLNDDPTVLRRRLKSRAFHDEVVIWLASRLREQGSRVFVLSEYVKERRIPDAILFDGKKLIAIEVETEKRWKPSHQATDERLKRLNSLSNFFDEVKTVFPRMGDPVSEIGPEFISQIQAKKD